MKRIFLSLILLLQTCLAFLCAQVSPTFDGKTLHVIQFSNSKFTIARMGTDANVQTVSLDSEDAAQLWTFTGSAVKCQICNKGGEYLTYNGSRLQTSSNEDASGWKLEQSSNTSYKTSWELKWLGTSDSKAYVNQFGGTGVGKELGLWTKGDVNNPLTVMDPTKIQYPDFKTYGVASFAPEHPLTLWYNQPATLTGVNNIWMEYSLPIGNGQLGASIFGGVHKDEIQFNEKTLWTGGPDNVGSYGKYRNFGSVLVEDLSDVFGYQDSKAVKDYVRYLDLENATAGVRYTNADGSTKYSRVYFSSFPEQMIVVRYKADGKDKLNLKVYYQPGEEIDARGLSYSVSKTGDAYATFLGGLGTVEYNTRLKVVPVGEGSAVEKADDGLVVTGASEVVLYLAGCTNFDGSKASRVSGTAAELRTKVLEMVKSTAAKGFDQVYSEHLTDFQSLMGRVSLQLAGAEAPAELPTNALVDYYNNTSKNVTGTEPYVLFLEQLYFSYGRYLEICSSRGVDVPSNLQGIWNNKANAPWNSDIHTNINVQMNYWPSEVTNLSEMHVPFLNYIITNAASANWQKVAKNYAKVSNGWTVFTESNIFGGMSTWGSNYFVANAWYCSHLFNHYRYTRDTDFLRRAFPAMWSACQFWMERMIQDRGYDSKKQNPGYRGTAYSFSPDGTYVAPDEYSPEQNDHSSEDATAHAQQLIYELLTNTRKAVDVLGQSAVGLTDKQLEALDEYIAKTDQGLHTEVYTANKSLNSAWSNPRNGVKKGELILREWKYTPYDVSGDPDHRHLSHLMALYPLATLSPSSPYFQPAVNSLKLRGDAATGWSMGWKTNLWARAHDGDHAHIIIHNALKHSTSYSTDQYKGGIYYNLYDSHAPFQIDGNFGVCSGIAEMLLQSHTDTLQLLPAVPSVWSYGEIKGLKAVGNFTVDQAWENQKLTVATITAVLTLPCPVSYKGIGDRKVVNSKGEEVACKYVNEDCIVIDAVADESYTIDMSQQTTAVRRPVADALKIKNDKGFITVAGNPTQVKVYSTTGVCLLATDQPSFRLDPSWGIVMVSVTNGQTTETFKTRSR